MTNDGNVTNMATFRGVPIHASSHFTWAGKVGVVDASDLGQLEAGPVWGHWPTGPVGFLVTSAKTGRNVLFKLVDVTRDREREVVARHYESVGAVDLARCLTKRPEALPEAVHITIYND